jgi:hypothetical protein
MRSRGRWYQSKLSWQAKFCVWSYYLQAPSRTPEFIPPQLSKWSQTLAKLFQRNAESIRGLNFGDGLRRIPLHHRFGRDGFSNDASGGYDRSPPDRYSRQYDHSRAECGIFLDHYPSLFAIMRNNGDPHSNRRAVTNGDQMWARRFYYGVVPDPHILSDLNAAPAVEPDAQSCGTRRNSGEQLKYPIL